jgi:hypothetical protein
MPKYPLEPLLEHRERKVVDATAELGRSISAREAAERARELAEARRRDAEERAAHVKAAESGRLARGELRAVDLARADSWEIDARAGIGQLTRAVDAADQGVREAAGLEAKARGQLAERLVERDIVAKDEVRFAAKETKRVVAAEEEAADEAFSSGSRSRARR